MVYRQDISTNGSTADPSLGGAYATTLETEVLIVGAGFGGVYLLHKLRNELGMQVKVWECGKDLGGIWHWNCYPGARVDSPIPVYEFSIPEIWKTWTWSQKYPGYAELRRYFDHVDKVLQVKKDCAFNTRAVDSQYDDKTNTWTVKSEDGRTARCKYLIIATGFAAKRHFPDWKGLDKFKGVLHHSSFWPNEGLDVKGKHAAVIGTGATGIQLSQELAKQADHLTAFIRTPNLCLPMQQGAATAEEQQRGYGGYPEFYKLRRTTATGFPYDTVGRKFADDNEQQHQKLWDELFTTGGFRFWLGNYDDLFTSKECNSAAYDYWQKRVAARISDPKKRAVLAPTKMPHYFGTKRPSLEQDYYETMDRPSVEIVSLADGNDVKEFTEKGLVTMDGREFELDVIALATGFDSITGGMKNMGLKDAKGEELADKWGDATWTYLGMTVHGYPNMFFLYGAQGMSQLLLVGIRQCPLSRTTPLHTTVLTRLISTCTENFLQQARQPSPTARPASKSKATGLSRPSRRCARRT